MSCDADLLERYRGYLRVLAGLHLHALLRGKLDPSDVVQQTMLRAVQGFDELRCREPAVVAAWLRQTLARTMADLARDFFRGKRDVSLERPLEADLDRSSAGLVGLLADGEPSPSQQLEQAERQLRIADALLRLPEAMREAVVRKHLQGYSLAEIAAHLGRTPAAVASLLRRGLEQLREHLREDGPS